MPLPPRSPYPPALRQPGAPARGGGTNRSVRFADKPATHSIKKAKRRDHPRHWYSNIELELFEMFAEREGIWDEEDIYMRCANDDIVLTPRLDGKMLAMRMRGHVFLLHYIEASEGEEDESSEHDLVYRANGGKAFISLYKGSRITAAKAVYLILPRKDDGQLLYFKCMRRGRASDDRAG
mmetsp:Transcript_32282/g.92924  ORF Transcript_32282/g.92924 Transcript_32282/m.92924 type:complete len:180 (-) Transcript_32282:16-555(-)